MTTDTLTFSLTFTCISYARLTANTWRESDFVRNPYEIGSVIIPHFSVVEAAHREIK